MKKGLVSALAGALVIGAASTTFAAANPFSDVPADHWAYDAVSRLAADGVIEGYGDGTYRGDRAITRYEMAQLVARAMTKSDVSAKSKALIDKLSAEFSDELNNLGVRVSNLEKHADMVKWTGVLRYTYRSNRVKDGSTGSWVKANSNQAVFRIEPKAEVNDHWTVNARLEASTELSKDTSGDVSLKRAWAQGNYKNLEIRLGKFQFKPQGEHGLIWDTEISGAQVAVGKDFKGTLVAGRLANARVSPGYRRADSLSGTNDVFDSGSNDPTNVIGLRLQYDNKKPKSFFGGVSYYHITDDDLKRGATSDTMSRIMAADGIDTLYSKNNKEKAANIWTIGAGYRFSKMASIFADYGKNSKADLEDHSWTAEFDYGNYHDGSKKGDWKVYLAYRQLGYNTSLRPTGNDDALRGTKGWAIGAMYAPLDNIGLQLRYFDGKTITTKDKARKLFARVDFFF